MKWKSLAARDKSSLRSVLFKLSTASDSLKSSFVQLQSSLQGHISKKGIYIQTTHKEIGGCWYFQTRQNWSKCQAILYS